MAIDPSVVYPLQTDTSDPVGYPHGKAQNLTAVGAGNGFPLEKTWVNDLLGFQQSILASVGATPSGTPDKVGASQYLDALGTIVTGVATASVKSLGVGSMNWVQLPVVDTLVLPATATQWLGILAPAVDSFGSKLFVFGSQTGGTVPMMGVTRQGVDWTAPTSLAGTTVIRDMASNGATIVAVGDMSNHALYSFDGGLTFSLVSAHAAVDYTKVCCAGSVFYAINGAGGAVGGTVGKGFGNLNYVATTGTQGTGSAPQGISAGGVGGNSVLVWGNTGLSSISADGGATWSTSGSAIFASGHSPIDIQYSAGDAMWMAISDHFEVAKSTDGVTWTLVQVALGHFFDGNLATDGAGLWVVALHDSTNHRMLVTHSTDKGVSWQQLVLRDVSARATKVCYSAQQNCFFVLSKDFTTTTEAKIFRSLATGNVGAARG